MSLGYFILHLGFLNSNIFEATGRNLVIDERQYVESASILAMRGEYRIVGGQPAHRVPLYTIFLVAVKTISGGIFSHIQFTQILLGFFSGFFILSIAGRFLTEIPAILCVGMFWFFPTLIFYRFLIYSETLYLFLILLGSVFYFRKTGGQVRCIIIGAAWGFAILTRAEWLFVALGFILYSGFKESKQAAVIIFLAGLLTISPWLIRNTILYGAPIISTNSGYNVWLGHNPEASGTSIVDDKTAHEYHRVQNEVNRKYTPLQDNLWSAELAKHGSEYALAHPWRTFLNGFKKLAFLWCSEERILEWTSYHERVSLPSWIYNCFSISMRSFWLLAVLIAILKITLTKKTNLVLLLPAGIISGMVFLLLAEDRYHLQFSFFIFITAAQLWDASRDKHIILTPIRLAAAGLFSMALLYGDHFAVNFYSALRNSY